MINIRKDLIQEELLRDGLNHKPLKLSNKFIDKLFNHYYCHEMCENFYDSEAEVDSYISDMAYMYNYCTEEDINNDDKYFTKKYIKEEYNKEYTREEAKRCAIENKRLYDEYNKSERKIKFNNWQDPYGEGIWGMSQKMVDDLARETLKKTIKRCGLSLKDRLYYAKDDKQIRIYFYGRDFMEMDYLFIFMRKGEN